MYMAQLMPLPLTVSCSSKIQIGFTFLVPAYPGCPGKEAVNGCNSSSSVLSQNNERPDMQRRAHVVRRHKASRWPEQSPWWRFKVEHGRETRPCLTYGRRSQDDPRSIVVAADKLVGMTAAGQMNRSRKRRADSNRTMQNEDRTKLLAEKNKSRRKFSPERRTLQQLRVKEDAEVSCGLQLSCTVTRDASVQPKA